MILNLSLSILMTVIVVAVHLVGIFLLLFFLRRNAHRVEGRDTPDLLRQGLLMIGVVLGIFLLHTVEVWLYAIAYMLIGAFNDFGTALYFSATAFSTLGLGDVVLNHDWRLFGSVEGVTGLILIGWSSAFLLSVTSRLKLLEHNWETYAKRGQQKRKRK